MVKSKKIIVAAVLIFLLAPWLRAADGAHLCGDHVCSLSGKQCEARGHHHGKDGHGHEAAETASKHRHGGLKGACSVKSGCEEEAQRHHPEDTPFLAGGFLLQREEPRAVNLHAKTPSYEEPLSIPAERPPAPAPL